jgi:hypothetical protein
MDIPDMRDPFDDEFHSARTGRTESTVKSMHTSRSTVQRRLNNVMDLLSEDMEAEMEEELRKMMQPDTAAKGAGTGALSPRKTKRFSQMRHSESQNVPLTGKKPVVLREYDELGNPIAIKDDSLKVGGDKVTKVDEHKRFSTLYSPAKPGQHPPREYKSFMFVEDDMKQNEDLHVPPLASPVPSTVFDSLSEGSFELPSPKAGDAKDKDDVDRALDTERRGSYVSVKQSLTQASYNLIRPIPSQQFDPSVHYKLDEPNRPDSRGTLAYRASKGPNDTGTLAAFPTHSLGHSRKRPLASLGVSQSLTNITPATVTQSLLLTSTFPKKKPSAVSSTPKQYPKHQNIIEDRSQHVSIKPSARLNLESGVTTLLSERATSASGRPVSPHDILQAGRVVAGAAAVATKRAGADVGEGVLTGDIWDPMTSFSAGSVRPTSSGHTASQRASRVSSPGHTPQVSPPRGRLKSRQDGERVSERRSGTSSDLGDGTASASAPRKSDSSTKKHSQVIEATLMQNSNDSKKNSLVITMKNSLLEQASYESKSPDLNSKATAPRDLPTHSTTSFADISHMTPPKREHTDASSAVSYSSYLDRLDNESMMSSSGGGASVASGDRIISVRRRSNGSKTGSVDSNGSPIIRSTSLSLQHSTSTNSDPEVGRVIQARKIDEKPFLPDIKKSASKKLLAAAGKNIVGKR